MATELPRPTFIFELANNHMGDVSHGLSVIEEFGALKQEYPQFTFAFKLQYRDLRTFIHEDKKGSSDIKYVKRFEETALSSADFESLINKIRESGFLTAATPFDEVSVEKISRQNLDIVKVASCSFTDWPLLEEIAKLDKPIVASTAGAEVDDIDRVVAFLKHREKEFAILHCVGQYPTPDHNLQVGQIEYLRDRYPGVMIGFSSHEHPDNTVAIQLAIAKGGQIFEKHVGLRTDSYPLNDYSITPDQARKWLDAAQQAIEVNGSSTHRPKSNSSERKSLTDLRRGIFVKRDIEAGCVITREDVYFAFPAEPNQFTANEWSKYSSFITLKNIEKDGGVLRNLADQRDSRALVLSAANKVKAIIKESQIVIPGGVELEFSHHYGMEQFEAFGLTLITVVNRGYCKKILVSLPNQLHPEQFHKKKEETFHILFGEIEMSLDGVISIHGPGDIVNVEPEVRHSFKSQTGAVIEEISSTHYQDDSYYTDDLINKNSNRKTLLTYWMD